MREIAGYVLFWRNKIGSFIYALLGADSILWLDELHGQNIRSSIPSIRPPRSRRLCTDCICRCRKQKCIMRYAVSEQSAMRTCYPSVETV